MKDSTRSTRNAVICIMASLFTVPAAAHAQGTSISIHAPDSVSYVVSRRDAEPGEPSIQTLSREATLILRNNAVILQLTDKGLDHLFDNDRGDRGILVRIAKAGVSGMLDHGIAYRVSALKRAYADGGRIVLEDRKGAHVFETTTYNDHRPMEEFSPGEARRFARLVQQAIDSQR